MASYGATKTPLWTMLYVRHLLWVDDLRVDDPRVDRELVVAVEGRVACAWGDVWVRSEGNTSVRGRLTSGWGGAGGTITRHQLEDDDAERPEVGRLAVALLQRHLGRHVERRAAQRPAAAAHAVGVRHRVDVRREAKVGQLERACVCATGQKGGRGGIRTKRERQTHPEGLRAPSSATRMFSSLMSRWMMPCACTCSTASSSCAQKIFASASSILPCDRACGRRVGWGA